MTPPVTPPLTPPYRIGNLGEIAIRCRDYPAMPSFYRSIPGLELLSEPVAADCFFRRARGHLGHAQVLALVAPDAEAPHAGATSSLLHIALGIAAEAQDAAQDWQRAKGPDARYQHFPWVGWRGLFTTDPDGNTVERVAFAGKSAR